MSARTLEEAVEPQKRAEFEHRKKDFCGDDRHPLGLLPRTCCAEHNRNDQKHPLLFKLEFDAQEVIALTSKTYFCVGFDGTSTKFASKGVQKRWVRQNQPKQIYQQVLDTGVPKGAENHGFRPINGTMYTYCTYRTAFPFLYLKRDLINAEGEGPHYTRTLPNVVLKPCPQEYICVETDMPLLCADNDQLIFAHLGFHVTSIRQAYTLSKLQHVRMSQPQLLEPDEFLDLQKRILETTDAKVLNKISLQLGICTLFAGNELQVLFGIVQTRMDAHPLLYRVLDVDSIKYIVYACQLSDVLGNGQNRRVTRYKPLAYLEGKNYLGKVYMRIRSDLRCLLTS